MCKRCEKAVQASAESLREDLLSNRLEVVLVPSRDNDCAMRGGKIRAVQAMNPDWYRQFCSYFESSRRRQRRKFDTKIKRQDTLRGLAELASGETRTEYAKRLRVFIKRNGYPLSQSDWPGRADYLEG